jgi:carbonic anhydrase
MLRSLYSIASQLVLVISSMSLSAYASDAAIKVNWGYEGNNGPEFWSKLDPSFKLCTTGKEQSPVDISQFAKKSGSTLAFNYEPAPIVIVDDGTTLLTIGKTQTLINDGHTLQLNFPGEFTKESISFNGKDYRLVQFHFHTPSENKQHGQVAPLEIHFVHQGDNGTLAVVGVFVKEGKENLVLQKILENLPIEKAKVKINRNEHINPLELLPKNHSYYNFAGSLTTPPCAEGVQWLLMSEAITASAAQIEKLKIAINGNNARPVQDLNHREVVYMVAK